MALTLLTGCSQQGPQQGVIRDRLLDYQAAYVEPTLRVPEGLSDERIQESLPIPGIEEPTAGLYGGSFTAPRAEAAARTIALPAARRYDVRGLQWLAIPQPIASVWPRMERLLNEAGIQIVASQTTDSGQQLTTGLLGDGALRLGLPAAAASQVVISVNQGLRPGTAEIQVRDQANQWTADDRNAVLESIRVTLTESVETARIVSSALAQLDQISRMVMTREQGVDHLVIGAPLERVFPVAADMLQDLRALIGSGDLSEGTIQFQYVRKATEQRLQSMTFLNRSIATTIEDPVGRYRLEMTRVADNEVKLAIVPVSGAASLGGVNELIRELLGRLY